jgi:hypothetical protein
MFGNQSRYFNLETSELVTPEGRKLVYVKRRFLPAKAEAVPLAGHFVGAGDRLDNITARYLRDPEQFWRIADANDATRPEELTQEPTRLLVIPLPREV